jgi:HrpA-like RNA helicase
MLSIGIKDVEKFDFLDRPPPDAIAGAQRLLRYLGAVDASNSMTEVGKRMAAFPLEPRFTRAIFAAKELGCT